MPERSIIDILLRARGGRQVEVETSKAARGLGKVDEAADRTNRSLERSDRHARRAGGSLLTLGNVATGAGLALGYGLYRGARTSLEAFMDNERTQRMTASALKSTGNQAGITGRQIGGLATHLSRLSGFDDEAIQQGQNLLLTFRDVRDEAGKGRDIFTQTSKAAVDMAAFFTAAGKPMDAQEAFLLLGKAMNDPAKGLTRLTRQGVSFNKQQVAQIKTLTKQGDTIGAQRVILAELNKEFGGAASTYGKTTEGSFKRLGVAVQNVEEQLGGLLAPTLTRKVLPALTGLATGIDEIAKRKDIDLADKLKLSADLAERRLRPLADSFVAALKRAHLDDKLQHVVEWATPKIAEGMAHSAPRAASAFLHGFWNMDVPGRLLTAAVLWSKFGPVFTKMGKLSGRRMGRVFGLAFLLALPDIGQEIAKIVRGPLEDMGRKKGLLGDAARTILGYDPRDMVVGGAGYRRRIVPGYHKMKPGDFSPLPGYPDPTRPGHKRHPIGTPPAKPKRDRHPHARTSGLRHPIGTPPPARHPIGTPPARHPLALSPRARRHPIGATPATPRRTRRGSSAVKPRVARSAAYIAEGEIPVVLNLDGKQVAEANARIVVRKRARS